MQALPFQAGWPTSATEGGGDWGQTPQEEAGVEGRGRERRMYENDSVEVAACLEV